MYFHDRLNWPTLCHFVGFGLCICKPWIYSPGTRMLTFLGLVISIYTFNLYLSPASWVGGVPELVDPIDFEAIFSKQKNNEPPFFSSPKDFLGLSAEVPQTHHCD